MGVLLDLIFVVLYLFGIYLAARKGFVMSLLDLIVVYVSFFAAVRLAGYAADWLYGNYFQSLVINKMIEAAPESLSSLDYSTDLSAILALLPDSVRTLAESFGFSEKLSSVQLPDAKVTISGIEQNIAAPIITSLLKIACTIVIFIVISIVLKLIARLINESIKKSYIRKVNIGLGAALGAVKGLISVGLLVVVCVAVASMLTKTTFASVVAESKICSFVVSIIK